MSDMYRHPATNDDTEGYSGLERNSGIVESIKSYPAKGEAGRELTQAHLIENFGLEGDFHARVGGDRQVSILLAEIRDMMTNQQGKGLCFSRFKENICIRGLAPGTLRSGTRLEAGEAVLEITDETKHCHEECTLYETGKLCSLAGMNLFAKVIKGGVIHVGDEVKCE